MAESADHRHGTDVPHRTTGIPRPRPEVGADADLWWPGIPAPRAASPLERWAR